jgi:hypothetical protein
MPFSSSEIWRIGGGGEIIIYSALDYLKKIPPPRLYTPLPTIRRFLPEIMDTS